MAEKLSVYSQFLTVPMEWFTPPISIQGDNERLRKIDNYTNPNITAARIKTAAQQSRLPLLLLPFGSWVHSRRATDLDLNIIFDKNYLSQTNISEMSQGIGLEDYGISAKRSDEEELIRGEIHVLGYNLHGISLKFSSIQNVTRLLSDNEYVPRIERRPTGTIDFNKLRKSTSISGKVFYPRKPALVFVERNGVTDFIAPGILYIPSLQEIALPYTLDQFIPSDPFYDGTQQGFSAILRYIVMTLIVEKILSRFHLLDKNGNPMDEAYNPQLVYNIFYNREDFSESWKQKLEREYFKKLDEIRNR